MKIKRFKLISAFDSLMLGVLLAIPESTITPKGILQFSHGMTEHKERYLPIIDFFCSKGYICIIHDHRGHGESVKTNDDLGYFYENGAVGAVEDLYQISQYIKKIYTRLPLYIISHSMGTLITRVYLKTHDDIPNGVFLCGSPGPNDATGVIAPVLDSYIKLSGDHFRGKAINDLFVGIFDFSFKNENTKSAWICSDKNVVREFSDDPLCGFSFTVNGYKCLLDLLNETYINNSQTSQNKNLPIMFLSGSDDSCMGGRKRLMEAVAKQQDAGYRHVGHKIFSGMRHEVMNEIGKENVYNDILKYIKIFDFISQTFE